MLILKVAIPGKESFRAENTTDNKDDIFIMVKGSVHQKVIKILNLMTKYK